MKKIQEITGAGGGKKGGGKSDDNTLTSKARARIIEAISEGPILGLVNGGKSIYFDETPIENTDDTLNFDNVIWEQRLGNPDDTHLNGHQAVETVNSVEEEVKIATGPVIRTITDPNADAVRVIIRINSLFKVDKEGKAKTADLDYNIDIRPFGGVWTSAVVKEFRKEKATSPVQVGHRIELPIGGHPWDIRVTRITEDPTNDKDQRSFTFESFTTLVEGRFIYPHTALVAMQIEAETVGQTVPQRAYHVLGRIIDVPSNYDPYTRTYTGVWNGTFKQSWTNNPAWIFYDLLRNDRYALGRFIAPIEVSGLKWQLYTIGQYADEMIPSGFKDDAAEDILEPRFTYNGVIRNRQEAYNVLQSLATAFRGMGYWAIGQIFATADMPSDPVKLVTPANVIGGNFNYSSSASKARHSVAIVRWNNPQEFYRNDVEVVINNEALIKYGWREKRLDYPGCTSRGLARRYGKWILDVENNETEMVEYKASLDHMDVMPGNIISIADPRKANVRMGGRIVSHTVHSPTRDEIVLDAETPFDNLTGEGYKLWLTLPNGELVENQILWISADLKKVRIATQPVRADVNAVFIVTGEEFVPRQYRVIYINESEENIFQISALFHDPLKYARIEQDIVFEPLTYSKDISARRATNFTANEISYIDENGVARTRIQLTWIAPKGVIIREYVIQADTPTENRKFITSTKNTSFDIEDLETGVTTFYLTTVDRRGNVSPPVILNYTVVGTTPIATGSVGSLALVDADGSTVFFGRDASISWKNLFPASIGDAEPAENLALYDYNTVKVYHHATGTLLRETRVHGNNFTYTFDHNKRDCEAAALSVTATRLLRFEVTVTSKRNITSNAATLVVSNPLPAAVAPDVSVSGSTITVSVPSSADSDVRGMKVWIESTVAFDQNVTVPKYSGSGSFMSWLGIPGTQYFVRAGYYDFFDDSINVSAPVEVTTASVTLPVAPSVPTGLSLSTSLLANGMARVTATWNANAESDLFRYDILVSENSGNFVSFPISSTEKFWDVLPGTLVTVKIRSHNTSSLYSNYSATASITAATDNVAPDAPTGLIATAGFGSIWLEWDNNSELDLARYEIIEKTNGITPAFSANGTFSSTASTFLRSGLGAEVTRHYFVRAIDTSGNKSAWSTSTNATTPATEAITSADIQGIVDATSFASSVKPVEVVTSLPGTPHIQGRVVVLTTNNKLYRNTGSGWVASVPAVDVTGQLTDAQIAEVNAAKVAGQLTNAQIEEIAAAKISGQMTNAQIADLNAAKLTGQVVASQIADAVLTTAKFASSIKPVEILSTLPGAPHVEGRIVFLTTDNKLYRNTGSGWISTVNATDISGQISAAQIAALEASKITGQMTNAQIADLNAAKLSGTIAEARLASLDATKLTGTINEARIAALAASKITGQMTNAQIADLNAAKLTGQIVASQIADAALTTAKFASNIRPIEILSTLPGTPHVEGRMVFLTTDNKLYRNTGSGWKSTVASGDIEGQVTNAQIAALAASKITGQMSNAQIADLDAAKLTGTIAENNLASLNASKLTGTINEARIAALAASKITGQMSNAQIADLNAAKLTGQIVASQIADAALTTAKFASNIRPVEILSTLPGVPHVEGRMVFLTTDNKLYRNTGSGWISSVSAADISGQISAAQIAALEASKITGQMSNAQIADLDAAKLSGTVAEARLASLNASKLTGTINEARIAALAASKITGTLTNSQIADLDAAKLSGTIAEARLASLDATKLTGTINEARISALAASKITGQMTNSQIADLAAAKISGQIVASQIANAAITTAKFASSIKPVEILSTLPGTPHVEGRMVFLTTDNKLYRNTGSGWISTVDANDISGVISNAQIDGLAASKITGTLTNTQIADLDAAKLSGTVAEARLASISAAKINGEITSVQISNNAITAGKVAANAITTAKIAANAVTANEIASNTIIAGNITAGAITTAKIAANAVTANEIASNAITAAKISAGAITTAKIAAGAVTATEIAAGTITAAQIAANTITASEISTDAITAGKIAAGAVGASEIAAGAITAEKIAIGDFSNIVAGSDFENDALNPWDISVAGIQISDSTSKSGTKSLLITGQTEPANLKYTIKGNPGDQLYVEFYARRSEFYNGGIDKRLRFAQTVTDVFVNHVTYALSDLPTENFWHKRTGIVTFPNDATELSVSIHTGSTASNGQVYLDNIIIRRMNAGELIVDGAITSDKVSTNAITTDKIAANAVTANEIAANSVTTAKIAANAVTANEIAANTITAGQIASNSITAGQIATNTITAAEIAGGTITAVQIASGAITTGKIAANAVTANEIAANAVTAAKILAGSITAAKLAANTITSDQIAARTITTAEIAANAITANEIASNTIIAGNISAGAITTAKIAANAVTANEIAANAVTTAKIFAGAVTAAQIAANTITASKIAANTITASEIAANTITASQIAANTITAGQIAAGAIGANEIAADSITAEKMAIGDFSNIVAGSDFENDALNPWDISVAGIQISNATSYTGTKSLLITGQTEPANLKYTIKGNPGDQLYVEFYARRSEFYDGGADKRLRFEQTATGTFVNHVTYALSDLPTANSWRKRTGIITFPSYVTELSVSIHTGSTASNGQVYLDNIIIRRMNAGELIVDGAITSDKVAANAITAGKIAANAVTANEIAANTITTSRIAAGAITASQISTGAVVSEKIAANAVTANEIAANAVTTVKIAANAVTANEIAANAITAVKISAGSVTTAKIATNAVTANEIAAGTIIAGNISAGAITTAKIAANAVTANEIAANTITANEIAANTITASQMAANTITAGQIAAGAVGASEIAAGSITAEKIAIGDFSNIVAGSDFENDALNPWETPPGVSISDATSYTGTKSLRITAQTQNANLKYTIKGNPGDQLYVEFYVRGNNEYNGDMNSKMRFHSLPSENYLDEITYSAADLPTRNAWHKRTGVITFPSGVTEIGVALHNVIVPDGHLYIDDIIIRRMSKGELIVDGVITSNKVATNAITAEKIAVNTITANEIASNAITSAKIAAGAITAGKIAAGTIVAEDIASNAITSAKIAANAVTATEIAGGTITAVQIASGAITTGKIAANAVTANEIAANAVTAAKIAANAVTANEIAANTITAGQIAANTITAGQIAANTITASQIAANTITAGQIAAGAISASEIASNAITASKIVVQESENLFPDGTWVGKDDNLINLSGPSVYSGWDTIHETGNTSLRLSKSTLTDSVMVTMDANYGIPVKQGDVFWAEISARSNINCTAGFYYRIYWYNEDRVNTNSYSNIINDGSLTTSFQTFSAQITAPAGAKFAVWRVLNHSTNTVAEHFLIDRVIMRRANAAKLIVDGEITTNHLAADSITTAKIAANAVTTNQIAANSITATKIAGGTITAAHLAANTITAGQIAANAITATEISAGAVTTAKIVSGAITANEIASNAITSAKIAAGAITAAKITANTITSSEIASNTITAGQIAAGAIGANQIAVGSITAEKMGIGDFSNIVAGSDFEDNALNPWDISVAGIQISDSTSKSGTKSLLITGQTEPANLKYTIKGNPEDQLYVEFYARRNESYNGGTDKRLRFAQTVTGTFVNHVTYALSDLPTQGLWYKRTGIVTFPNDVTELSVSIHTGSTASNGQVYLDNIIIRRMNAGELIVDGAIKSNHLVTNSAVITGTAQIANAVITEAKISGTLNANKITAGTTLSNTVVVSGDTLGTIQSRASDPADRINSAATTIDPGKILISGSTTLSDWRKSGDVTKIDGGSLSANTVTANKLEIGSRGITLTGIEFEHNSPGPNQCSWTSGNLRYTNDAGSEVNVSISAGNVTWTSGIRYIYWIKDQTSFSTTATQTIAQGSDRLIVATYEGGVKLDADFGRTIIDGSKIKTATITANQIAANTITAGQIAGGTITASQIAANTITAAKIDTASFTTSGLALFGNDLRSTNFSTGLSGWIIRNDGTAEFDTIHLRDGIVTTDKIVDNAITRFGNSGSGEVLQTGTAWLNICSFTLNLPVVSVVQGLVYFELTHNASTYPSNFRVQIRVNGVTALTIERDEMRDQAGIIVRPFTIENVSAGTTRSVAFRIINANGQGVLVSNLSATGYLK